ncbi:MAG: metallophosphoesterase family protein [Heyndrickxia sp.]
MENITFIHCADLHLDSPFVGLQYMPKEIFKRIQESTFRAFTKAVDAAISKKVDFIIISGDLYDGEDRSIKAQARLRKQMERLQMESIDVFIIHGNHDHLGGTWTTIEMPKNVHVFSTDVETIEYITKKGVKVHLYGFSYPERHVGESKMEQYNKTPGADFHIGILHGHCEGGSSYHQPYAPFSIRDLLDKEMDYWALGHIHKQQILHENPYIIYPGNIQGRNAKEQSMKGCFAVTLSKHETTLEFIEASDIIWDTITVSAKESSYFHELFLQCKEIIDNIRKQNQAVLLRLEIVDTENLEVKTIEKMTNGEFIESLQDGEEQEENFVWTYQVRINSTEQDGFFLSEYQSFKDELDRTLGLLSDNDVFEEAIGELYSHIRSSRYLENISAEEKTELLIESGQMLSQLLSSKL